MHRRIIGAALAAMAATSANATGGLVCRTAGTSSISIALVISHTAVSAIVSARLTEHGREVPVAVAQSWLEPDELRLDLTDKNAMRHEVRLRAKGNGRTYDGSVWRNGQRRWVRCREA